MVSKKKIGIFHGMSNPRELSVKHYADHVVEVDEYFTVLPGTEASENVCVHSITFF